MAKRKIIMLLVTYNCNLHCSYCYEPKLQPLRMDATRAKRIITEQFSLLSDDYDSVEIQFMGGEPLLEFHLIQEVSEWLWSLPLEKKLHVFYAPTNGTLLDNEMKAWFTANKNRIRLELSFDGDQLMQDNNRSMSYKYIDVDYFVRTWPNQSVKMTISPQTIQCMSNGVKYLHEKGFKYVSAELAMGPHIEWDKESLIQFRSELSKLSYFYLSNPNLAPFYMLRSRLTNIDGHSGKIVKTCSCGEDFVCVDWTGKTYACHLFSPVAVSVEKAMKSNRYNFSDHSQFVAECCYKCILNSVCNHCYGMNYICSDDIAKPSSFHCQAFKIQFVANCRFRMALAQQNNDKENIERINNLINRISIVKNREKGISEFNKKLELIEENALDNTDEVTPLSDI